MSAEKEKGDGETVPWQIKRKEKQHISERKREKLSRKRGRRNKEASEQARVKEKQYPRARRDKEQHSVTAVKEEGETVSEARTSK